MGVLPECTSFAGRALDKPRPGGHLRRCRSCSLVFRDPIANLEVYEALYAQAPSTVWSSARSRGDQALVSELIVGHAPGVMDVLDIGCYSGSLLQTLGTRIRKYGVEPSTAAAAVAQSNGIELIGQTMRDLDQIAQKFDVVVAVDVIEHVPQPAEFLLRMLELTRPGGLIVVSTGNADAWSWRLAGTAYWYTELFEHISFISSSWVEKFAVQHGVQLESVRRFSYYDESRRGRWWIRVQYCIAALKTVLRLWLAHVQGRAAMPPRWLMGEAGLFADHFVFTLRRP